MGNSFRDGRVFVCEKMCSTCVFRPGNLMHLNPGRVEDMIEEATRNESAIICHSTLEGDNAVCCGFFLQHATSTLQVAERLGYIDFVPPPTLQR